MQAKLLFHCGLWGRTVSLWLAKDSQFLGEPNSSEVFTCSDTTVAATGKSTRAHEGA